MPVEASPMRWRNAVLLGLVVSACGALMPPRPDGGVEDGGLGGGIGFVEDSGIGGGGGGGGAGAWQLVTLNFAGAPPPGPVQRLVAGPGQLFAAVGYRYLMHSSGGQFSTIGFVDQPLQGHMNGAPTGRVAHTLFQTLLSCASGCDDFDAYDDLQLPRTPIAICASADRLALLTTASDAGAALFVEAGDGGWPLGGNLNHARITECARTADDNTFVAGLGGVLNVGSGLIEGPDQTSLGRDPALEAWTLLGTDGVRVVAASVRGAVSMRNGLGVWATRQALAGEVTALAVESQTSVWIAGTGVGLARWDGTTWHDEGAGPSGLAALQALALEGGYVYVGGVDAQDAPRVFRRPR